MWLKPAATLAARIFLDAPLVHILATSREALRVEGERSTDWIPLGLSPEDPGLDRGARPDVSRDPTLPRARAKREARLDGDDLDAAIVGEHLPKARRRAIGDRVGGPTSGRPMVCTRLSALLDQRLARLVVGATHGAAASKDPASNVDWSYGFLPNLNEMVLRRLAVFIGHFTLEAALAVMASAMIDQALVLGAVDSLVAKSMLSTSPIGTTMRYRLLDTTRAYVLEFEADDAELAYLAARHATYYRQWPEQNRTEWPTLATGDGAGRTLWRINNVRAALEWCFGRNGDVEVGVGLAAATAPEQDHAVQWTADRGI